MSLKTDVIQMSLRNAENWERKGNIVRANSCISSALMNLLSIAVERFANCSDAAAWLVENGTPSLLRKSYENLQHIVGEVEAGRLASSTYGGNYPYLVYSHLSWALQEFSLGEGFVTVSERDDVADLSTPFWSEYSKGVGALVRRQRYSVPKMKLRGQEEYWISYLYLIEAVSNGIPPDEALRGIDQSFLRRNSDKRIKDDSYETEGTGTHPAKWDYRRDSLITYVAHGYAV